MSLEDLSELLKNNSDVHSISDKYGFQIEAPSEDFKEFSFIKRIVTVNPDDFNFTVHVLGRELDQYPRSYVRKLGLHSIQIAGQLYGQRKHSRSVWPAEPVRIGGTVDFRSPSIYLAVQGKNGYQIAQLFHHELIHLSDYSALSKKHKRRMLKRKTLPPNKTWVKCNPKGAKAYSGEDCTDYSSKPTSRPPTEGFVDPYCEINDWEDRARMAEVLMRGRNFLDFPNKHDPVVKKKFEVLEKIYRGRSNGRMSINWFRWMMVHLYLPTAPTKSKSLVNP